jgi:hypothetical protein
MRKWTPRILKLLMILDLAGIERADSLAFTMNFSMYPVPSMNSDEVRNLSSFRKPIRFRLDLLIIIGFLFYYFEVTWLSTLKAWIILLHFLLYEGTLSYSITFLQEIQ